MSTENTKIVTVAQVIDEMYSRLFRNSEKYPLKERERHLETALLFSLKEWESHLPELDDYFHKSFRQCDPIELDPRTETKANSIMWHLLAGTRMFWEVWEDLRNPKPVEPEREDLD